MDIQKQQARNLYFQTDMTHADIAAIIGVSDQTIYRWIKQNNWKQMKEAATRTPLAIVEMLYKQLYTLNNNVCNRDEPVPTSQEAEINRKLINSIDKLKRQASLSENIQVLMGFTGFLNKIDNELTKKVVTYADQYLKEKTGNALLGFYEEPEEELIPEEATTSKQTPPVEHSVPDHVSLAVPIPAAQAKKEVLQQQLPVLDIQPPNVAVQSNSGNTTQQPKLPKPTSIHQRQLSAEQQKAKKDMLDAWIRSLDKPSKSKYHW